jgi:hypothetical protein
MRRDIRITACCGFLLLCTAAAKPKQPPPPPTPAPTTSLFPLNASISFDTINASRVLRGTVRTYGDRFDISPRGAAVTIRYDAVAGTYSVQDSAASASFGPSNLSATRNGFELYAKAVGTVTDTLNLLVNVRPGAQKTTAPLQLSHLSLATWTHRDSQSGDNRKIYLLFGFPTVAANMPRKGSATYRTFVTGTRTELSPSRELWRDEREIGGSATFNANFATGQIDTQLVLTPVNGVGSYGTFAGTGTTTGSQFSGAFTSTARTFVDGAFVGGFFGPDAKEMGYSFRTYAFEPDPYEGVSPEPMYVFMTGAVVGTKN